MGSKRESPLERRAERERLRQEIEDTNPEVISLGMMVELPAGELAGIFRGLKALRSKFPTHAEEVIGRVQRMLGATDDEMAAGLKVRPRNEWRPNLGPGSQGRPLAPHAGGGGPLADAGSKVDRPVDVGRALRRVLPEEMYQETRGRVPGLEPVRPPQSPNAKRAADAAAKATEKIITRVEGALKNAPKK